MNISILVGKNIGFAEVMKERYFHPFLSDPFLLLLLVIIPKGFESNLKIWEEEEIFLGQQLSKGLEERRLYVVDSPQCIVQAALSQQGCLWSVFVDSG